MTEMFGSATGAIREAVGTFVAEFDPRWSRSTSAKALVREWGAIENAAAAIKSLAAARVADAGRWDRADGQSAADWLAAATGTTAPKAHQAIQTGRRLSELEETAAAATRGELSAEQTAAIADAATADPSAERDLLGTAKRGSLRDLRDRCAKTKARADANPDETRKRIHAGRRLRQWTDAEGVGQLHANGPVDLLARIGIALRPIVDRVFNEARRQGRIEDPAVYAFDALIELADTATDGRAPAPAPGAARAVVGDAETPTEPSRPTSSRTATIRRRDSAEPAAPHRPRCRRRRTSPAAPGVYAAAVPGDHPGRPRRAGAGPGRGRRDLRDRRDRTDPGEHRSCQLLGEATLHLVITKGVDVANVTYLGRAPNAAQRIALLWQSPTCTVEGCPRRGGLQNDHAMPWAAGGPTELAQPAAALCTASPAQDDRWLGPEPRHGPATDGPAQPPRSPQEPAHAQTR